MKRSALYKGNTSIIDEKMLWVNLLHGLTDCQAQYAFYFQSCSYEYVYLETHGKTCMQPSEKFELNESIYENYFTVFSFEHFLESGSRWLSWVYALKIIMHLPLCTKDQEGSY